MKKQQKAFHVDDKGNLLDKKGKVVKKAGDFKLEGGYYIDADGEIIKRKIDKTKEKINAAVDKTKEAVSDAASKTKEGVKSTFKELFNTKAVGTAYTLPEITFDETSHRITGMSKVEVEGLANALKEHPDSRIQVQVHTADGKNRAESKQISRLRADVVKNMLVALGVKENQISSKGMGLTTKDAEKAVADKVEVIVEK
ncbi:MAG: OmpA family protein [Chitinophagales bacterium]